MSLKDLKILILCSSGMYFMMGSMGYGMVKFQKWMFAFIETKVSESGQTINLEIPVFDLMDQLMSKHIWYFLLIAIVTLLLAFTYQKYQKYAYVFGGIITLFTCIWGYYYYMDTKDFMAKMITIQSSGNELPTQFQTLLSAVSSFGGMYSILILVAPILVSTILLFKKRNEEMVL
ncbi:MAG: hypothetical protein JKY42_05170 [Flavobacteriales bacterium]|nr:hypothetical protein [Flavobacteriales bacterium]